MTVLRKTFLVKLQIKFNYNFCLRVPTALVYHAVVSLATNKNTVSDI